MFFPRTYLWGSAQKSMIDFKEISKNKEFSIDLNEMKTFNEIFHKCMDVSCEIIDFVTNIVTNVVREYHLEHLGKISLVPETVLTIFDHLMSDTDGPVKVLYSGSDDGDEVIIIADVILDEGEIDDHVVVKVYKNTNDGRYIYNMATKVWDKEKVVENKEEIVEAAQEFVGALMDKEATARFLKKNEKIKKLREHPSIKNLVCYSTRKPVNMKEDLDMTPENIEIFLAPDNIYCSGISVSVEEQTGKYCLCADINPDDYVFIFGDAFGEKADGYLDCIQEGRVTVFKSFGMQEIVNILVKILDHYTAEYEFAAYPLSKNEYMNMYSAGKGQGVRFDFNNNGRALSETAKKNMRIIMYMLGINKNK